MNRGENASAVGGLAGLEAITQKLNDPEFTRRHFLKGLGALSVLTTAQGLVAIEVINDRMEKDRLLETRDVCSDGDGIQCFLQEAGLDVPAAQATPAVETAVAPAPETTAAPPPQPAPPPPPPTTAPPPPPPPKIEAVQVPVELEPAPRRNMSYQEFAQNAEHFYAKLPSIETLASMFPPSGFFSDIPGILNHIEYINQNVQPSGDKYRAFGFNTELSGMFPGSGPLNPNMLVWHWTGWNYEAPADIQSMWPNSVQIYVHSDGVAYQLMPNLDLIAGHARILNPYSWGMEMHSGHYDGTRSPLMNFTPAQVETGIYVAVNRLRSRNLPVDRRTLIGHFAADLIFMNPYYDPYSGTFHDIPGYKPKHLHKFDPPQEFMDMVVAKAAQLDAELGPR